MISAIVVAAGKSSRMGEQNKLNLPFNNDTIVGTVLKNLASSKVDEIILVSSKANEPAIDNLDRKKIKLVFNPSPDDGLTASIQTGVREARKSNAILICLGDMPLVNFDEYNLLINYYLNNICKVIVQPFRDGKTGNPVLFSNHFREDLLAQKEPNGCKPIVVANQSHVRILETSNMAFFTDIDTIDQYEKIANS